MRLPLRHVVPNPRSIATPQSVIEAQQRLARGGGNSPGRRRRPGEGFLGRASECLGPPPRYVLQRRRTAR